VKNTGAVPGSEVVQLYVTLPTTSELTHPPLMLHAFAKVRDLAPGQSVRVDLKLDKYAVSYWDDIIHRWVVESGKYVIRVGRSSALEDLALEAKLHLKKSFEWNGL
jgi:beta-glucosidase